MEAESSRKIKTYLPECSVDIDGALKFVEHGLPAGGES
jgi:hypothetical protein